MGILILSSHSGLLLVATACVYGQPALCGLFLGMVCQVKIIPVLFAPVFFFYWWERRKAVHFVVAMAAIVLAGWLVPLLAVPDIFLKRVLAYNSIWGWWGFSYLIAHAGGPGLNIPNYSPPNGTVIILSQILKLSIIAGVLTLAWRKRHGEAGQIFSSIALCWGIFFVLRARLSGRSIWSDWAISGHAFCPLVRHIHRGGIRRVVRLLHHHLSENSLGYGLPCAIHHGFLDAMAACSHGWRSWRFSWHRERPLRLHQPAPTAA